MSSTTGSSGVRIKLPLLPSERERLHKQRVRGAVSDGDGNVEEVNDDPGASNLVGVSGKGGGVAGVSDQSKEKRVQTSATENTEGAASSPTPPSQVKDSEVEGRRKNMQRIRQYQQSTFSDQPALPMSTTSRVLQDVLLSSSQFVNAYVADASSRLEESSADIAALERQMGLLEGKFSSMTAAEGPEQIDGAKK